MRCDGYIKQKELGFCFFTKFNKNKETPTESTKPVSSVALCANDVKEEKPEVESEKTKPEKSQRQYIIAVFVWKNIWV